MKLISPTIELEKEFKEYILAFKNTTESDYYLQNRDALNDFNSYIVKLNNYSKGIDLPKGWLKGSSFWMLNNLNEILGEIRYRKEGTPEMGNVGFIISPNSRNKGYGKLILQFLCKLLKEKGEEELLLTCDFDNIASEKIIINCGGTFVDEIYDETDKVNVKRFLIKLK